ncbi:hypothetical protein [Streptomyces caniferus]|uniref:hypothetical protein n=1 Tax=Streptomyces caniferus TaxID=285557 RepID=UPI003824FEE4
MDQDDDGLPPGAVPDPRSDEAELINRSVTHTPPRTQTPEQIAGRKRDDRGDDGAHHAHRMPMAESRSTCDGPLIFQGAGLFWSGVPFFGWDF